MNKLLTFIKKISYAILPMVLFIGSLLLSWYLNQVITNGTQPGDWHYGTTWPKTALDDKIPLVPAFVYIYYLTLYQICPLMQDSFVNLKRIYKTSFHFPQNIVN